MTVSAVIPAWGETPLLARAMDSVRRQTASGVELIVSAPPANGPQTALAARLAGVRRARGEWILFVDADDWIESDLIEALLRATGEDVDAICSGLVRGRRMRLPSQDIWTDIAGVRREASGRPVEDTVYCQTEDTGCDIDHCRRRHGCCIERRHQGD